MMESTEEELALKEDIHEYSDAQKKKYTIRYRGALLTAQSALRAFERIDVLLSRQRDFTSSASSDLLKLREELMQAFTENRRRAVKEIEEHTLSFISAHASSDLNHSLGNIQTRQGISWREKSFRLIGIRNGDSEDVVTHEERQVCFCVLAWLVAILGMCVAVCFLIADFWTSQKHPAIRSDLEQKDTLHVPVVTFCSGFANLPAFENFPNEKYPGHALFGVRRYRNLEKNSSRIWPEAQTGFNIVFVGPPNSTCDRDMRVLSMTRTFQSSRFSAKNDCLTCFQLGTAPSRILIRAPKFPDRKSFPISVSLGGSKLANYCFERSSRFNSHIMDTFHSEIKKHLRALEERGTIDLSGEDYDFAVSQFRLFLFSDGVERYTAETASFVCNIYFFAGYFYPAEEADIRYRFSADNATWIKVGKGPYHRVRESINEINRPLEELKKPAETNTRTKVFLYVKSEDENNELRFHDRVGVFDAFMSYSLLFSKTVDNGVGRIDTNIVQNTPRVSSGASLYNKWEAHMDFQTFNVEVISHRPATSIWEFVTDIFEYAGLFTGVCVYSIIVAPAKMYLRKSRA